jgi:hypothetical protein
MNKEKKLLERIAYLRPAINGSMKFALHGPKWLPVSVRKIPLSCVCWFLSLHMIGI